MRPWQHSLSSIKALKGSLQTQQDDWAGVLKVHEFLDASKAGCADRRHRIVLHHCDLGAEVAARAFPDIADVDQIVAQHVKEDLRCSAVFMDWLADVRQESLPRPVFRRIEKGPEAIAEMVLARCAGVNGTSPEVVLQYAATINEIAKFLWLPLEFAPSESPAVLSIFMNCVGPVIVRNVFGPPIITEVDGARIVTDHGWIAEAVIMASFGRIPDLTEVIHAVSGEPGKRMEF